MKEAAKFALVIREGQYDLDDFAFRLTRSQHLTPIRQEECELLASNLERLAALIRGFDPSTGTVRTDSTFPAFGTAQDTQGKFTK